MFSNAESVYINNKEVASIVTADGGVLYQKDSGYDLLLTCDNPILSFNDGDACTLSGVLTFNGVVVPDEPIDYNIMHDGTVLDSGSLTTDDNGEINLNYIAAGVGDVDVVFSLRSLLQKTYVIHDAKYYDTNTYTNGDTIVNIAFESTVEFEILKKTNSISNAWGTLEMMNESSDIGGVGFDSSSNSRLNINDGNNKMYALTLPLNTFVKVKVTKKEGGMILTVNGIDYTFNHTLTTVYRIHLSGNVQLKNLLIN